MADPRYRCDACGNLTRFDVTTSKTTKAFHHYTVGGELQIEEEAVLALSVDDVVCRWCGHGRSVVEIAEGEHIGEGVGEGKDGAAVGGLVNEPPPAEVFRRLRPIPTYEGEPASRPHGIVGLSPDGGVGAVPVMDSDDPVLLLFLKEDCVGCHDFWDSLDAVRAALPPAVGLAVVTRDAAEEDVEAIASLGANASGVPTVMSSQAFADYQVLGPPFFVLADRRRVRTEGVAWGLDETLRAVRAALDP